MESWSMRSQVHVQDTVKIWGACLTFLCFAKQTDVRSSRDIVLPIIMRFGKTELWIVVLIFTTFLPFSPTPLSTPLSLGFNNDPSGFPFRSGRRRSNGPKLLIIHYYNYSPMIFLSPAHNFITLLNFSSPILSAVWEPSVSCWLIYKG